MKVRADEEGNKVSFVTIFGDNELYRPEDGNYDFETNNYEEAKEWFDNYGTDEDMDESLNESADEGLWQDVVDNDKILAQFPALKSEIEDSIGWVNDEEMWSLISNFGNVPNDVKRHIANKMGLFESLKEARYSDAYDDNRKKQGWWYFTTHGVMPGSIPKGLNVLDTKEGKNSKGTLGTFVKLDGILNTSELRQFDMKEESPGFVESLTEDKNTYQLGNEPRYKHLVDKSNEYVELYWEVEEAKDTLAEDHISSYINTDNDDYIQLKVYIPDNELGIDAKDAAYSALNLYSKDSSSFDVKKIYGAYLFKLYVEKDNTNESLTEKLIEPSKEVQDRLERLFDRYGFKIDGKGKTMMGSVHYQISSDEVVSTQDELVEFVEPFIEDLDPIENMYDASITWNFGADKEGHVTAGIDIHDQWVADEDESLTVKEALNKLDIKCLDENLKYYDLRNLFEATQDRMDPQKKQELRNKLNDPNASPEDVYKILADDEENK